MGKENDAKWGELNKALVDAMKDGDWGTMKQLYNDMVYIVAKEGKDATYLLKERNKAELMGYKSSGIKKASILTARKQGGKYAKYDACDECYKLEGKIYDIDEALKTMPIPHPQCTKEVFKGGHYFCRCLYTPIVDIPTEEESRRTKARLKKMGIEVKISTTPNIAKRKIGFLPALIIIIFFIWLIGAVMMRFVK